MSEKCARDIFCSEAVSGCFLLDNLRHQDKFGSSSKPDCSDLAPGPYWHNSTWLQFIARTINMGSAECDKGEQVIFEAHKITEDKRAKGEII